MEGYRLGSSFSSGALTPTSWTYSEAKGFITGHIPVNQYDTIWFTGLLWDSQNLTQNNISTAGFHGGTSNGIAYCWNYTAIDIGATATQCQSNNTNGNLSVVMIQPTPVSVKGATYYARIISPFSIVYAFTALYTGYVRFCGYQPNQYYDPSKIKVYKNLRIF